MNKYRNLHDNQLWTLEEMKQLRNAQMLQGIYGYDTFEEWLDNQLNMDFIQVKTKRFSIPVTWEVWDKIEIEAETIEEAIQYFKDNSDLIPLGIEPEYIDGSYKIDDGENGGATIENTVKYLKEYWNLSGGIDGE